MLMNLCLMGGTTTWEKSPLYKQTYFANLLGDRSGSVVECLTQAQGAVGWSLPGVTALCP